jgi:hypothetical protein
MAWEIILSKTQQERLKKQIAIDKINEIIPLHKVGIHWFGKCVFCNDQGHHMGVLDTEDKVVCFNEKCHLNCTTEEFLEKFNLI